MWSARGAYRNADGRVVQLPERSPLWTDKTELVRQMQRDYPGLKLEREAETLCGDWYRWFDDSGAERFVVIEEHR